MKRTVCSLIPVIALGWIAAFACSSAESHIASLEAEMMNTPNSAAAERLVAYGSAAKRAQERVLVNGTWEAKWILASILERKPNPELAEALYLALRHEEDTRAPHAGQTRLVIARSLAKLGKDAVPYIIKLGDNPNDSGWQLAWYAVHEMAFAAPKQAFRLLPWMRETLPKTRGNVRRLALAAIMWLHNSLPKLAQYVSVDDANWLSETMRKQRTNTR